MVNIIKTTRVLTIFFSVLVMAVLIIGRDTHAGGGINYKVTVGNPTDYKVKVWVFVRKVNLSEKLISNAVILNAGESHTWETGAKCPTGIEGQILAAGKWMKMKSMDCLGGDHNYETSVVSTCCWDISARVCQKAGQGYTEVRDHDYGFCKN